jgi:hypothetical protein
MTTTTGVARGTAANKDVHRQETAAARAKTSFMDHPMVSNFDEVTWRKGGQPFGWRIGTKAKIALVGWAERLRWD